MNRFITTVVGVLGMAFIASAAYVDFTGDAFNGVDGKESFTSAEYGITLSAAPEGWAELTRSADGIGIDWLLDSNKDEIDGIEVLTISFGKDVNLESVYISNLYRDEVYLFKWLVGSWDEKGNYELSTGEIGNFVTESQNGELTLDINKTVSSISLYATDDCFLNLASDFSVRGVSYTSVPEPALLSLLGISLVSLGFVRNRKK